MFCPPDFIPLVDLFEQWQSHRHATDLQRVQNYLVDGVAKGHMTEWQAFNTLAPADLSEHEFFKALGGQFFASSPSGTVMRLSHTHFTRLLRSCNADCLKHYAAIQDFPILSDSVNATYHVEYNIFGAPDEMFTDWLNVERSSRLEAGVWDTAEKRELGRRHQIVSPFHDRVSYLVDLRMFDFMSSCGILQEGSKSWAATCDHSTEGRCARRKASQRPRPGSEPSRNQVIPISTTLQASPQAGRSWQDAPGSRKPSGRLTCVGFPVDVAPPRGRWSRP